VDLSNYITETVELKKAPYKKVVLRELNGRDRLVAARLADQFATGVDGDTTSSALLTMAMLSVAIYEIDGKVVDSPVEMFEKLQALPMRVLIKLEGPSSRLQFGDDDDDDAPEEAPKKATSKKK